MNTATLASADAPAYRARIARGISVSGVAHACVIVGAVLVARAHPARTVPPVYRVSLVAAPAGGRGARIATGATAPARDVTARNSGTAIAAPTAPDLAGARPKAATATPHSLIAEPKAAVRPSTPHPGTHPTSAAHPLGAAPHVPAPSLAPSHGARTPAPNLAASHASSARIAPSRAPATPERPAPAPTAPPRYVAATPRATHAAPSLPHTSPAPSIKPASRPSASTASSASTSRDASTRTRRAVASSATSETPEENSGSRGATSSRAAPAPQTAAHPAGSGTEHGAGTAAARGHDVADARVVGLEFPYPGYLANLVRQVRLRFAPSEARAGLHADLAFIVARDGSITDIRVVRSSGNYAFDLEAQGAVEAAGSARAFGPLPDAFRPSSLPVNFSFDPRTAP